VSNMKQKIRGHNRRQKQIEHWVRDNVSIDLADYLLNTSDRHYVKIRIHPWNGFSLKQSKTPEPSGKTKQKMLAGLLDIYTEWKKQLDESGVPYYLKIWLFEPRFSQSQVVCATGDNLQFYDNTFFKPAETKELPAGNYHDLKSRLDNLNWDYCLDEDHFDNNEVGEPEQYATLADFKATEKWYFAALKTPHRTTKSNETTEVYSFKRGDVWTGGM